MCIYILYIIIIISIWYNTLRKKTEKVIFKKIKKVAAYFNLI